MKYKKLFLTVLFLLAILAGTTAHVTAKQKADPLQPEIAAKILRFHVLANSDSDEDQAVKLQVRDAVGHLMEEKLKGAKSRKETEKIVENNMEEIIKTAEAALQKNGYTYGASAKLKDVDFPVKTYGNYTFPAGKYRALQITLGEGKGHNWWCVLYPNMCFQGSVYEVVDDEADHAVREVLTQAEYADVFNSGKVEVRWKILEYFR